MMCFTSWPPCTAAEVWSRDMLCTHSSSTGHVYTSRIYTGIWLAKKISALRLTGVQLIITEHFSPWIGMTGFPHSRTDLWKGAQGKMSILHVGKLSQAICFQGHQIPKFLGSAPAWVQLNPVGRLQGWFGLKGEQAHKYGKWRTKDSIHLSV